MTDACLRDYFSGVYGASSRFIQDLALAPEALPLDELGQTRATIERRAAQIVAGFIQLRDRARPRARMQGTAAGLNTIGMLCDRLTVLAMKEWVLENRQGAPAQARALRETQVAELLDVLGEVQPGHSSYTQKLTAIRIEAPGESWEETYFGLLATNVLLWESQEVLYGGRIAKLECEELRRYIAWFSEGNIRRNLFIARCEPKFWAFIDGAGRGEA